MSTCPLVEKVTGPEKQPYPLEWNEEERLLAELPPHLKQMALFDINTGLRESALIQLRWEWEVNLPELRTSVFVCPGWLNGKNDDKEYLVVLNRTARRVLEEERGKNPEVVFSYQGNPLSGMYNSAWKRAWVASGLSQEARYRKGLHNHGIPLDIACARPGCRLKTVRTCSGIRQGEPPLTTPRRTFIDSFRRSSRSVTGTGAQSFE